MTERAVFAVPGPWVSHTRPGRPPLLVQVRPSFGHSPPVTRALGTVRINPTGELRNVHGTPFDFTRPTSIGARINQDYEQLKLGKGYDHNFVLDGKGGEPSLAARVSEPVNGRVLEVLTTQPGVQFYTVNHLDGSVRGKGGVAYGFRFGFCLETQHFPDSPNHPAFPSAELRPGRQFRSTTIYRFSTN